MLALEPLRTLASTFQKGTLMPRNNESFLNVSMHLKGKHLIAFGTVIVSLLSALLLLR